MRLLSLFKANLKKTEEAALKVLITENCSGDFVPPQAPRALEGELLSTGGFCMLHLEHHFINTTVNGFNESSDFQQERHKFLLVFTLGLKNRTTEGLFPGTNSKITV